MGRDVAAQRPTTCPNASLPADRQSTGGRVERDALRPLILGQPARRRQRPSPRLSARSSERVAFAPPLPRKSAPSRTVGVGACKGSKLRITEIKAGSLGITRTIKVHSPSVLLQLRSEPRQRHTSARNLSFGARAFGSSTQLLIRTPTAPASSAPAARKAARGSRAPGKFTSWTFM